MRKVLDYEEKAARKMRWEWILLAVLTLLGALPLIIESCYPQAPEPKQPQFNLAPFGKEAPE